MKRAAFLIAILALWACGSHPQANRVLAGMRADTALVCHLDSLAQTALGPGAKCLDPVSHSFSYDGRIWIVNEDWGGVLEIPSGYLIEDNLQQAELSFHGTRVWSPDSLIRISFYAGFLVGDYRKYAVNDGGTCYSRLLPPNEDGVVYGIAVTYTGEKSEEVLQVIEMADRFPAGPGGTVFRGEAF